MSYIKNLEEYPRMHELVSRFIRTHYDGTPDIDHNTEFLFTLLDLLSEGEIFYDSKHDAWLFTGIDSPKLQKLVDESVSFRS